MLRFAYYFFSFSIIEGVQLLCLIDKGLDACRYLQTYGEWERAASLAKVNSIIPCEDVAIETYF